ncbi:signal peptidase I [Neorhodopirellula lusitana]|uniref:Signal peptidase I n=1 Tax=Neorhodopirellula lusitana TaxID=445327 RepID=A0ABY1Q9K8_9BACT|nr:signal peptidase I [Neorhodopirellula lusitana]SMP62165.1 signal peptidase I [Neorhodopirellula lusitana]
MTDSSPPSKPASNPYPDSTEQAVGSRASDDSQAGSNANQDNAAGQDAASDQESASAQETWDALPVTQQRAAVFRVQAGRETMEAFVVAFVLALLFRAFIAEAFVIPTGSMAPALMGAHKDVFCDQCGQQFPIGASLEFRSPDVEQVVVGGVCPNCRHINSLDIANTPDDTTFSGDRILVSKFAYAISDPDRWDVIVFKVPVNPKQNYIKRLVGLPNETLTILHGDVYAQPGVKTNDVAGDIGPIAGPVSGPDNRNSNSPGEILRKPPSTLLAMKHVVYNSDHQADSLIQAAYPARLQPWKSGATSPPEDSWQVTRSEAGLVAKLPEAAAKSKSPNWLRYYHRWPSSQQWQQAIAGQSLASLDPYRSRLVTDFHAYDAYLFVDADRVYDLKPSPIRVSKYKRLLGQTHSEGVFRPDFESGGDLSQFRNNLRYGSTGHATEGMHWVGDLIVEADLETAPGAKSVTMEIVEAGVRYHCQINLEDGLATMTINDGQERSFDPASGEANSDNAATSNPQASTSIRAGSRHSVRFSNCDNQLVLWVDDEVIEFDRPTTFNVSSFLPFQDVQPIYNGPGDPGDASPVGITVRGGAATIHQMTIDRDKYYIATNTSQEAMLDYDMQQLSDFAGVAVRQQEIQAVMGEPTVWSEFPGWASRRRVSFPIGEDQFFPMGDNSPESLDARCWAGTKEKYGRDRSVDPDSYRFANASYVPRDLLVGKALAIFWPHPWRSPVPMTPNFQRMRLIR